MKIGGYYIPILSLFFIGSWPYLAQSAAPIVHAYFADLYFTHCNPQYTRKEKDAFLRGTLFPDIRYIARIPRITTHKKDVTLQSVKQAESPFMAGLLFHTYVDEQRERIAQREGIYKHLSDVPKRYRASLLKAIEDEVSYTKIDTQALRNALKSYDSEERNYGVYIPTRMLWHRLLGNYFKQSPLAFFRKKVVQKVGYVIISAEQVAQAYHLMEKYTHDPKVTNYVSKLTTEFENLLKF